MLRILVLILLPALAACSSFEKLSSVRNSTLSNINPAPEKLSLPSGNVIDESHKQSRADYYFSMAEAYSLDGNSKKAIEAFKSSLVYDAESVLIRTSLSKEYAKIGFMSEALEQSEAAVELSPTDLEARLVLGSLYSSLKMYDLALSQYYMAMDIDPNDQEAPLYIGAIYAEQEKFEEAIKHFKGLAKRHVGKDKEFLYYYYIGRVRVEQGDEYLKQAEVAFSKSISLKPGYSGTTMALAKVYLMQKKDKQAMRLMQSYQERFSPKRSIAKILSDLYIESDQFQLAFDQLEILEGYDEGDINLKLRMALLLIKLEKKSAAIDRLREILRINPSADKVRFYLGSIYEDSTNVERALKEYALVPVGSLFYTDAVIRSSHLLSKMNQDKQALDVLRVAIENDPDTPTIYVFYASILDRLEKFDDAEPILKRGLKKFPKNTQLLFFLGSVKDHLGEPRETVKVMKEILKINEDHVQALNYLAYTYAVLGENLTEAEELVDRALEIKPKDGFILDTKGWVLFKQGRTSDAIKYLETAYRIKSDESIIAEHLGDAYFRYELVEKAKKMYIQAFKAEVNEKKQKDIQSKISATEIQLQNVKRLPASLPKSSNK